MDPRRRGLLLSLALAPVAASSARATPSGPAAPDPASEAAVLRVAGGGPSPDGSLRYGDGFTVLRAVEGRPLRIGLVNGLAAPTSLDLHGLRVAPPLGGAGPVGGTVAPGQAAEIAVVPPEAGTAWFHPWITDPAVDATAQGLAGALVVAEASPPDVDADLVALVSDRWPPPPAGAMRADDVFRVNGAGLPRRETLRPGSRVRLRMINGSTRQAVRLVCRGAVPVVVALDGQPCAPFRPRGASLPLGPGARADLMVDLPGDAEAEVSVAIGDATPGGEALVLHTAGDPRPARGPVPPLPANPALPAVIALERATRATLLVDARPGAGPEGRAAWTVNGVSGVALPNAPLFAARRGTAVSLAFRNAGPELVCARVHGACLRLLHDLDDGWEPYWRDAVLVPPGATHHAAFVADRPGRRLIESTFFAQAAGGLRTWFEVT